jgi:hypothetical protein
MSNKRTDYSKTEANRMLKEFQSLSGVDPLIYSQKPKDAYFRALLYKVLMDFNYMNDRQIAEFFLTKGITRTRVAVFHAVSKVDIYYLNYSDFRDVYNVYFDDKAEESKELDNKLMEKAKDASDRAVQNLPQFIKDDLYFLIHKLPLDKRNEIYELVNLRVKSWDWKSKDKCEIIESSDGISSSAY